MGSERGVPISRLLQSFNRANWADFNLKATPLGLGSPRGAAQRRHPISLGFLRLVQERVCLSSKLNLPRRPEER